jgi:plasmid stability protein
MYVVCFVGVVGNVKRKTEMARTWTSQPPGTKGVRLNLDDAVHAKLRILAAEAGLPMSAFVRQLAENAVRERFPEVFGDASKAAKGKGRK